VQQAIGLQNSQHTPGREIGYPAINGDRMQFHQLKRREFITLLGGAAVGWPPAARGQPADRVRRIGWLHFSPESDPGSQVHAVAFRQGMEKLGWSVGRNLAIDYRWGAFNVDRARVIAAELLNLAPDVIVSGGTPGALAFQQMTHTVPIVFAVVTEPVTQGIVQSLAHPGGNMTGFAYVEPTIGAKWVELLKDIAPKVTRVALVFNPDASPQSRFFYQSMEAAAPKFAVQSVMVPVRMTGDIQRAMATMGHEPGAGLIISTDTFLYTNRKLIIELAARHGLPAIYGILGTAAEGGLIYYGVDVVDQYQRAAGYVDRILRGTKPADLPVQLPTKFSLTINAKTAKALGLNVPDTLLVAADEVID
jgi:putative tryptophan/tyrosine transport system substrate-binding protein